ncbi:MAG: phospholipase, partial [Ramlibacter sp.]|nr:phospholipase [Ramlibacter sp.]
ACAATADAGARLACFDRWAQGQKAKAWIPDQVRDDSGGGLRAGGLRAGGVRAGGVRAEPVAAPRAPVMTSAEGCHDQKYSGLSRFWELEAGSDCSTFGIRGYRPISLSVVTANNVNNEPTSGNPLNTSDTLQSYRPAETRLQLSVRTKLAQNLLTGGKGSANDSLWFGYTQQSYWQVFNGAISRPFRTTDHEPELIYVYPTDYTLPAGWRLRYSGLGLVHQSNGQALPLSRSWNRVYLMAGMEHGARFTLQARAWKRLPDSSDDNPGISDYIGRGEVIGSWAANRQNVFTATVRSSLNHFGRGSVRLEWLRALGNDSNGAPAGLRLHTQLFSGYGDSLIDYNNRRTVLSVGLSLVDW